MKTQITKVEESKTFKMFKALQDKGFNVILNSMFCLAYRLRSSVGVFKSKQNRMYECINSFKTEKGDNIWHGQIISDQEYNAMSKTEKDNFRRVVPFSGVSVSDEYVPQTSNTYDSPISWPSSDSDSGSSSSSDSGSIDFGGGDSGCSGSGGDW